MDRKSSLLTHGTGLAFKDSANFWALRGRSITTARQLKHHLILN